MSSNSYKFRAKPVVAAIAMAFAAPLMLGNALAATVAGNVPVNGTVVQGSATIATGNLSGVGTIGVTGGSETIALGSTANVINWGQPNNAATLNPVQTLAGFNIGTGSTVTFDGPTGGAAVLNVDNSGNASTIDGTMTTGTDVNVFVANANGIVVGSTAVLTAPVLGLIASNVDSTVLTQTTTLPTIALSFQTAGSISVANGANLNGGTTDPVLIAGAGTVNIAGTSSDAITSSLIVDGGVSGLFDSSNSTFTPTTAAANTPLTTAATNVTLNLGTSGTPFVLSSVYADGDIVNNGVVQLSASPEFTGTFTNNGIISNTSSTVNSVTTDFPLIIGSTSTTATTIYVNSSKAALFGSVVNNGTISAANGFNLGIGGNFTNATSGKLVATGAATMTDSGFNNAGLVSMASSAGAGGSFVNNGGNLVNSGTISADGMFVATNLGNFSNSGTITALNKTGTGLNSILATGAVSNTGTMILGNTTAISASPLSLTVVDNNFSNTGTLSLLTPNTAQSNVSINSSVSSTLAGSFSAPTLDSFTFTAGTTASSDVAQINTGTISAAGTVNLSGFNINLNSSVNSASDVNVTVGGYPSSILGTLSVASGASLAAGGTLNIQAKTPNFANVSVAGTLQGSTVKLGTDNAVNNINIGGVINANSVNITAAGVVNKAMGGGTAAENYLDNAALIKPLAGTPTVQLAVDAVGNHLQTWNIKADGNLSAYSYTNNFTEAGLNNGSYNSAGTGYYAPAANAYSQLRLQATSNLTLTGGKGLSISPIGSFTWPGQLVAIAAGDLVTTAPVDNAFSDSGAYNGIYLQGNSLKITAPIYTNNGSWINFSQTGYGQNGITANPALMTSYYQLITPTNVSTGVKSYASAPIAASSLKTGREFLKGYVPSSK